MNSALAELKDIHLPKAVGFWPMALGWYVLFIFFSIGLFFSLLVLYRHIKNSKAKRHALVLLECIEKDYQKTKDVPSTAQELSVLVRRVALSYYPRRQVAGLAGSDWQAFLGDAPFSEVLATLPYVEKSNQDLRPLFAHIRQWIKRVKHG